MSSADKLPLLKESFSYLVSQLDGDDIISIVTYSGKEEVILEGCEGNRHADILNAIEALESGGSTYGEAGLQKAYQIAEQNKIPDGNNRIIMASDGDLNVGISSPEELKRYISEKKNNGIFLSVMGFGTGNFRDENMSALAQNGNGVYYYIDCLNEAKRVFSDGLLSTLYTVGKDVKLQLTFDPAFIAEYRLIGYENRMLATEDFDDDQKDAGEVGAGHCVTVCYELKLAPSAERTPDTNVSWFSLALRYKKPDAEESILKEYAIGSAYYTESPSHDFRFVCTVIETAMLLRNSVYRPADLTLNRIIAELESLNPTGQRAEFLALLKKLNS